MASARSSKIPVQVKVICFALASLGMNFSYAQQFTGAGQNGAGLRLEPFVLYPAVTVGQGYNDNVALSNANRTKSAVTVIAPAILAELKGSTSAYRLSYFGQYGRYASSNRDNYDYSELHGGADFDFSARSRLNLVGDFAAKSDPRGSNLASTTATTPNKYNLGGVGGVFSYGARGAMGRVELEAYLSEKRYTNNRAVTETLDFDAQKYGATFFWRVAPKTELLIQGEYIATDYTSSAALGDNNESRIFTGLKWEATAATSGTFKVGYANKDFTRAGATDARGFVWQGAVRWSPLTYSVVDLTTGKSFNDPFGAGNTYDLNRYINAKWTHGWTERIKSEVLASYTTDNYEGIGRNDKTSNIGVKFTYDMRRWLTLGAEYSYTHRDSTVPAAVYDKNLIFFSAKATL